MSQTFGALLRQLRKRNGMTQNDLAIKLGYSRSLVAALEGNQRLPEMDAVSRTFVPALGLAESPQLAAQLLELAALARNERPPSPIQFSRAQNGSVSAQLAQNLYRMPADATMLVGREHEIEQICDRFLEQDVRLLTLVGPPGVGKTRLAQAVATRLQAFFADGACFVPLAGVTSAEFVDNSLLTALGVRDSSSAPALARLVAYLRHKEILLLLDNFEQILPAAPQLAHLLAECPGLRLLVTSRERLYLRAEHVARVRPLLLTAAIDLFVQRAHAADADLVFSDASRGAIEALCIQLDCLPLSIELCAAQSDYYSPEQLVGRLRLRPLDTLSNGAADLPPRQHSLRAAIQASYDLLDADERTLFRDLSVFAGGCNPDIVGEVCLVSPTRADRSMDDLLRALTAKNLTQIETTEVGDKRMLMLGSVREFARERLHQEGDPKGVRARHFDAYLAFARLSSLKHWGPETTYWNKRVNADLDNIRVALQWSSNAGKHSEMARLIITIKYLWARNGLLEEECDWIEKMLSHCDELDADLNVAIKSEYGFVALSLQRREKRYEVLQDLSRWVDHCHEPLIAARGWRLIAELAPDATQAVAAFRRAIELARTGRNRPEAIEIFGSMVRREISLPPRLFNLAAHLIDRGETGESESLAFESLEIYQTDVNPWGAAVCVGELGRVALLRGEIDLARGYFKETVDAAVQMGDLGLFFIWQPRLALATLYAGDAETARRLLDESQDACISTGDPNVLARYFAYSAEIHLAQGKVEAAHRSLSESLTYPIETQGIIVFQIRCALLAARLAAATAQDERAAALFGLAHAMSGSIQFVARGPMKTLAEASMAEVRLRLGEELFQRKFAAGQQIAPDGYRVAITSTT